MRRRPRFCSTSSMSCGIWARLWIRFARAKMGGLRVATGATSGPEIHFAVAQGEPHARRQEGIEDVVFGQQAAQHGLCPQGELWPVMELRTRGLGAALLRETGGQASSGSGSSPYGKFAAMIDRHWDGIAAYCRLENKVLCSALSKGSTTRSGSSSGAPTACATRTTTAQNPPPACCRSYSRGTPDPLSGRRSASRRLLDH